MTNNQKKDRIQQWLLELSKWLNSGATNAQIERTVEQWLREAYGLRLTISDEVRYHLNSGYLTGKDIRSLMKRSKTTIRDLAHRMQITQKRVREVRSQGVRGREDAKVYLEAIIMEGRWYGPGGVVDAQRGLKAPVKVKRSGGAHAPMAH